jgi:hypothetical protein
MSVFACSCHRGSRLTRLVAALGSSESKAPECCSARSKNCHSDNHWGRAGHHSHAFRASDFLYSCVSISCTPPYFIYRHSLSASAVTNALSSLNVPHRLPTLSPRPLPPLQPRFKPAIRSLLKVVPLSPGQSSGSPPLMRPKQHPPAAVDRATWALSLVV